MVKKIQNITVSRQRRKQRKKVFTANAQERAIMMSCHLSKELKEKYGGLRTVPIKQGDSVEILTGQFKGRKGKVKRVRRKKYRIYVERISHDNSKGQTKDIPIHPSNCVITKLNVESNRRRLEQKKAGRGAEKKVLDDDVMVDEDDGDAPPPLEDVNDEKKVEDDDDEEEVEDFDELPPLEEAPSGF